MSQLFFYKSSIKFLIVKEYYKSLIGQVIAFGSYHATRKYTTHLLCN